MSCQTFFWRPFQPGLFYDSYSSWTAGCTTQLTLTLKNSWKCFLNLAFPICVFNQSQIHNMKIILRHFTKFSLYSLPLILSLYISDRCLTLAFPHPPSIYRQPWICTSLTTPHFPNHLTLRLNKPSSPSLLSHIMGFKPWPSWWVFTGLTPRSCSLSSPGSSKMDAELHMQSHKHSPITFPAQAAQDAFGLIQTKQNSHLPFCRAAF